MKTLILLTNFFPYGTGEPYLETEVKYYDRFFDRIYVASLQLRKNDLLSVRPLPSERFNVLPVVKAANWVYLLNSVRTLVDKNLYIELWHLLRKGRLTARRLVSLFVYLSRSYYEAGKIVRWLRSEGVVPSSEQGAIYSYRFEYQPYVALLLKKQLSDYKVVARGHRFDLYEERRRECYIPLREYLLRNLDRTVMIAKDGVNYIAGKYPKYADRLLLSRLGVADNGRGAESSRTESMQIVSCSTITAVKRVNLIVEALALVKGVRVHWDHYGEGVLADEIKELATKILPASISYCFHGYVDNHRLLKIYQSHPYHLFLNVSSSEGIPVSIMEAMSFGIPCIATDVGGTNEIVEHENNGILLSCNLQPHELAKWISAFATMDSIRYSSFRITARSTWQNKFSAELNYSNFLKFLSE